MYSVYSVYSVYGVYSIYRVYSVYLDLASASPGVLVSCTAALLCEAISCALARLLLALALARLLLSRSAIADALLTASAVFPYALSRRGSRACSGSTIHTIPLANGGGTGREAGEEVVVEEEEEGGGEKKDSIEFR